MSSTKSDHQQPEIESVGMSDLNQNQKPTVDNCMFHFLLHFLDAILEEYIPEEKLREVRRILYGFNQGKPVQSVDIGDEVKARAEKEDFEVKVSVEL
jgi:hypothetical protein